MKKTENLHLQKFEGTDKFDYKVINENWEKIDDEVDKINSDLCPEYKIMTGADFVNVTSVSDFMNTLPSGRCTVLVLDSSNTQRTVLYNLGLLPWVSASIITFDKGSDLHINITVKKVSTIDSQMAICSVIDGVIGKWEELVLDSELTARLDGVELWENPSITSEFPAQTITLSEDISNYQNYEIEYVYSNSNAENRRTRQRTSKTYRLNGTFLNVSTRYNYYRSISAPSGNSLSIGDCMRYETYGDSNSTIISNGALVPWKVRGYK